MRSSGAIDPDGALLGAPEEALASRAEPGEVSLAEEGSRGSGEREYELDAVIEAPGSRGPVEGEGQARWRQAPRPGQGPPNPAEPQSAIEAGEAHSGRARTQGNDEPSMT